MSHEYHSQKAFISADGSYSAAEELVTFEADALTDEQWGIIDILPDGEKIIFALACLDGDEEVVNEYLEEYRE